MIIDFHTHIFPAVFRRDRASFFAKEPAFENLYRSSKARLAGTEDLIRSMDEGGIHRSVIFGFPWDAADRFKRHNDYIMESVQRFPDRFIGFGCFSVLSPEAENEAERCLSAGLSGIGELAVYGGGFSLHRIPALKNIMETCRRFDVPILIHTNEPVGHLYPGKTPMTLRELYSFLKAHPLNRIVLAHWGGGIFFYALMKKEVGEVLRNVWFDTAASPFLYRPHIYRAAGEIIGLDRILFGSDYPLIGPGRYFQEMREAGLSDIAVKKITGENAVHLLKRT